MAYSILWRVHGILMASSFIAMSAAISLSLGRKGKKGTFQTHRGLGIYAASAGITALLIAFTMVQLSGGSHMSGFHAYMGVVTILLLAVTPLFMILKKARTRKSLRKTHKILGFTTLFFMGINLYSGLNMMGII